MCPFLSWELDLVAKSPEVLKGQQLRLQLPCIQPLLNLSSCLGKCDSSISTPSEPPGEDSSLLREKLHWNKDISIKALEKCLCFYSRRVVQPLRTTWWRYDTIWFSAVKIPEIPLRNFKPWYCERFDFDDGVSFWYCPVFLSLRPERLSHV